MSRDWATVEDKELVECWRARGDGSGREQDAINELYRRSVKRCLRYHPGGNDAAKSVLGLAFANALKRGAYDPKQGEFMPYLRRSVRNMMNDLFKNLGKNQEFPVGVHEDSDDGTHHKSIEQMAVANRLGFESHFDELDRRRAVSNSCSDEHCPFSEPGQTPESDPAALSVFFQEVDVEEPEKYQELMHFWESRSRPRSRAKKGGFDLRKLYAQLRFRASYHKVYATLEELKVHRRFYGLKIYLAVLGKEQVLQRFFESMKVDEPEKHRKLIESWLDFEPPTKRQPAHVKRKNRKRFPLKSILKELDFIASDNEVEKIFESEKERLYDHVGCERNR